MCVLITQKEAKRKRNDRRNPHFQIALMRSFLFTKEKSQFTGHSLTLNDRSRINKC